MFRFALNNLLSRPFRSLLSILGLTVAIAGMVGLFSVASGVKDLMDKTLGRIPGIVAMQPGAPIPLFSRFPAAWVEELRQTSGVRSARSEVWSRAHVIDGVPAFNPPRMLFGMDVHNTLQLKQAVYRDDLVAGRFLTDGDANTLNCLISKSVADDVRKGVGETLRVDGHDLSIVGIYECGSILLDVAILVDQASVRKMARFGDDAVSAVYMELDGSVEESQVINQLKDKFRGRGLEGIDLAAQFSPIADRMLGQATATTGYTGEVWTDLAVAMGRVAWAYVPRWKSPTAPTRAAKPKSDEDSLEIRSAADWSKRIQDFTADLDLILVLMTAIGLAIALLSIINVMMMSVTERMVEFGVLRANGWTPPNILQLIAYESALIGICGGILGAIAGNLGAEAVNWYWPTKIHLYASWWLLGFAVVFSVLMGVLGGMYPAWWAARMSPMAAIRRA